VHEALEPQEDSGEFPSPRIESRRAPLPVETPKTAAFNPGELVRHKTFGLGRVKKFVDMGPSSVVVVSFNSGQTKSLLLQYADLTKV
jgi:hypothetical protein